MGAWPTRGGHTTTIEENGIKRGQNSYLRFGETLRDNNPRRIVFLGAVSSLSLKLDTRTKCDIYPVRNPPNTP